jgi:hypothetical protein
MPMKARFTDSHKQNIGTERMSELCNSQNFRENCERGLLKRLLKQTLLIVMAIEDGDPR